MNEPGAAGLTQHLPMNRRFPRLPRWLGQILPALCSGAVSPPSRRGAPLPRTLAPVAPQADRSPPVASLPDRLPGRGETQQMLDTRDGRRERHGSIVLNTPFAASRYSVPLPTAPARLASSIIPLSPVLPAAQAWRSLQAKSGTALHQPASDAQLLPTHSDFRSQAASSGILLYQPPRLQVDLENDGHREYSIDLAR